MTLIDVEGMTAWLTARHYSPNTQVKILRQLSRMRNIGLSELDLNTMDLDNIYQAIYDRPLVTRAQRKHISLTVRRYQEYQARREAA